MLLLGLRTRKYSIALLNIKIALKIPRNLCILKLLPIHSYSDLCTHHGLYGWVRWSCRSKKLVKIWFIWSSNWKLWQLRQKWMYLIYLQYIPNRFLYKPNSTEVKHAKTQRKIHLQLLQLLIRYPQVIIVTKIQNHLPTDKNYVCNLLRTRRVWKSEEENREKGIFRLKDMWGDQTDQWVRFFRHHWTKKYLCFV